MTVTEDQPLLPSNQVSPSVSHTARSQKPACGRTGAALGTPSPLPCSPSWDPQRLQEIKSSLSWSPLLGQGVDAQSLLGPTPGPFMGIPHFRNAHSSYQKHLLQEAFRERYTIIVCSSS